MEATPLHWAAGNGHEDVAALLLANKADVNSKDKDGWTPLHWAVRNRHQDIVQLLLASKADINSSSDTPLHLAVNNRDKAMVELLLASNVDVNAEIKNGGGSGAYPPLFSAVRNGDKAIAELLLSNKAEVNYKSLAPPLCAAAVAGRKDLVELLIAYKADVNGMGLTGTPLCCAAGSGMLMITNRMGLTNRLEIANLLLANGADVNAGRDWITPLNCAAEEGFKEMVELLLANGAEVNNGRNKEGFTPLHCAAFWYNGTECMQLLLSRNAAVNTRNNKGETPLHYAHGKAKAELLMQNGAEINARANDGATPLHWASKAGYQDVVETLLAHQAAINAKDTNGDTPLTWALKAKHLELAEYLRQHGGQEGTANLQSAFISNNSASTPPSKDGTNGAGFTERPSDTGSANANQPNHNRLNPVPDLQLNPAARIDPGAKFDYSKYAFQPKSWEERGVSLQLTPWTGKNVVFLTTDTNFDPALMGLWVSRLDAGWQLFADLTGRSPTPWRQFEGKVTIAAVPGYDLTCGAGCGYIGTTGIELAMFYDHDYQQLRANSNTMPHYVFYEMGRNYYTFGDRHSCFITGFAVFMRYVCMDRLKCEDMDAETRRTIEGVEKSFHMSALNFLDLFTMSSGIDEKVSRIKDTNGNAIQPSDQPVCYASAMLRLRRENGGDVWVKRFFHELANCPTFDPNNRKGALNQSWYWLLCASIAAQKDLSPVFVREWKLPLNEQTCAALANIDWRKDGLTQDDLKKNVTPIWKAEAQ